MHQHMLNKKEEYKIFGLFTVLKNIRICCTAQNMVKIYTASQSNVNYFFTIYLVPPIVSRV